MCKNIMVSIVCNTYNHKKYIRKCLDSLISQKVNFLYEILVHDDASIDGTDVIVKEYEEKYPDIIKGYYQHENQYSKGIRITRQYQYTRARGKYIAFCEGDDFWVDDYKLQKQYDIMENYPECYICVGKTKCCNEDGSYNERLIPDGNLMIEEGVIKPSTACSLIFQGYTFQTASYFARREVLDYAFKNDYMQKINGDEAYLLSAVDLGSFYYINETMNCYRLNACGSWNERMQGWDKCRKISHQIEFQEAHFVFYNATGRKFTEQIIEYIVHRCYIQNRKYLQHIIEVTNISYKKILDRCDFKHKLLFLTIMFFPPMWKWYLGKRNI